MVSSEVIAKTLVRLAILKVFMGPVVNAEKGEVIFER